MAARKRKAVKRKPVKRKAVKRKVAKRRKAKAPVKASAYNRAAYYKAYKELQKQVDKAWKKFCADKKRKANANVMAEDHKNLLLLLGECNYFARECMRLSGEKDSGQNM